MANMTNAERLRRMLRAEGLVSRADLRVDVASEVSRLIADDETTELEGDHTTHARGDYQIVRGRRSRRVGGRYERHVAHSDMFMLDGAVEEKAEGGVHLMATVDAEVIMGGAYVNTIAGAYVRVAGWADFLAWGGWLEADAVRVELALTMIRSHWFYAHAAGARVTNATGLVDDFTTRIESWGVLTNNQTTMTDAGSPGGGIVMET